MSKQLFAAAFQNISTLREGRLRSSDRISTLLSSWREFCNSAIITYVTGEEEHPADSGHLFVRMARQHLGISESQIMTPEGTLEQLLRNGPRPVIFVDDFIGTGLQFVTTWNRNYSFETIVTSFKNIAAVQRDAEFYYCSLASTESGMQNIKTRCPQVVLSVANTLTSRYSAFDTDSILWSDALRPTAETFLRGASARAGLPDTHGAHQDDWRGFNNLGLAIVLRALSARCYIGLVAMESQRLESFDRESMTQEPRNSSANPQEQLSDLFGGYQPNGLKATYLICSPSHHIPRTKNTVPLHYYRRAWDR